MSDVSPAVAKELYPLAVREARAGMIRDIVMLIIIAAGCAMLWAGRFPVYCIYISASAGIPALIQSIKRYKRLRHLQPSEAAASGEP